MSIQVVDHDMPPRRLGIGRDHALHVRQKVGLGPGRACGRRQHLARGHIPTEDKRAGAVADIFELPTLDLARRHRKPGIVALQALVRPSVHPYSPPARPAAPT